MNNGNKDQSSRDEDAMPKVFISYSWTSVEHRDRIRRYAERLIENHVNVLLDIWDLTAGQDKNAYMEQMVVDPSVTHVLAFIDKRYTEKANARKDGVGTESQIISQRLYSSVDQTKFVPIFCEKDETGKLSAPCFFESRIGFDFSTPDAENANWEPLIRFLFGKPEFVKPKLGPVPQFLDEKNALPVLPTSPIFDRFKDVCSLREMSFDAVSYDYVDAVVSYLDGLRLRKMPAQKELDTYDEIVYSQLIGLLPLRNQFLEWMSMYIQQTADADLIAFIGVLFPKLAELRGRPPELTCWNDGVGLFDVMEIWVYEIVLYLVAMLIKYRRDIVLHDVLFARYYMMSGSSLPRKDLYGISEFHCVARSFYNRNQRLELSRMDLLADWVKEHSSAKFATFEELMGADGVLYLTSLLKPMQSYWYPRTYVYAEWGGQQIALFDAARDVTYAGRLLKMFGEKDLGVLKSKIEKFKDKQGYSSDRIFHYFYSAIGYEQWGTLN